jgi:Peptidase_C39 like family
MLDLHQTKRTVLLSSALLLLTLVGCGGGSSETSDASSGVVKHSVVNIYQNNDYTCATTSAAMAISYFDKLAVPISNATAWDISGSSIEAVRSTGNDMDGLKRLTDHYRYKSEYVNNMSTDMLEGLLAANALVVLNIKAGDTGNATHAVLATGYNKSARKIYVNDPAGRLTEFDYSYLEIRWSAFLTTPYGMSNRSGFVIYPVKF